MKLCASSKGSIIAVEDEERAIGDCRRGLLGRGGSRRRIASPQVDAAKDLVEPFVVAQILQEGIHFHVGHLNGAALTRLVQPSESLVVVTGGAIGLRHEVGKLPLAVVLPLQLPEEPLGSLFLPRPGVGQGQRRSDFDVTPGSGRLALAVVPQLLESGNCAVMTAEQHVDPSKIALGDDPARCQVEHVAKLRFGALVFTGIQVDQGDVGLHRETQRLEILSRPNLGDRLRVAARR